MTWRWWGELSKTSMFSLRPTLPIKSGISSFVLFLIFLKISQVGERRRWQKSKTRRSPSSPQTHQKYIYTWNCSYRTPTESWQKTSDLPKGKKLPIYLSRAKEKRKNRDKRIGTGPAPVGGSCEGGKVSTH